MAEFRREMPHLYLRGSGRAEPYGTKTSPPRHKLPQRDRYAHAAAVEAALTAALAGAQARRAERDPELLTAEAGFYLDFEIPAGSESAAELLENRQKHIELVAVRQESPEHPAVATVFVPDVAAGHLLKKVEQYRQEETRTGKPKNEAIVARIERVALAAVQSLFTDDRFPEPGETLWWEAWIRIGRLEAFTTAVRRRDLPIQSHRLIFPDREVRLVFGDAAAIGWLFLNSDSIAELRRAKDTPSLPVAWSNVEQAIRAAGLAKRLIAPTNDVAVCLLDTGVTQAHPLLSPALDAVDVQKYDPTWSDGDTQGHGTNMAGTALYGDLLDLLEAHDPVVLTHRLESVKVLPDKGANEPRLYGAITAESVARAQIVGPGRRRVVSLAVTSDIGTNRGRPSSWSAAVDQLAFADERALVLISAGNIRDRLSRAEYPARNETESIENPAQAWNAVTVGAFTAKANIIDPSFAGWQPVAPAGDLCPTSRTSLSWERQWPIKPDILMEGGNWAALGDDCDTPDDLGLLTTYRDPTIRHFDIFRDTSAATAMAGNLAGRIWAAMPQRWPETIRALMIHSAEWTPLMRRQFDETRKELRRLALLRKYGYGVANYERAVLSTSNDLTLIAEDEIFPFRKEGSGIKTHHMNLHELPWPRAELEQLGETEVELRVTLSYFVEPNPGERGWLRRHRYASHALRFAVNRALESVNDFRRRINAAITAKEESLQPVPAGSDEWVLGRVRNVGSIHSDYWYGTAADLARRSAIGVYPVGGWWKENPYQKRYERQIRYALIVSIRAVNGDVDIYTPVRAQIAVPVPITG